MSRYRCHGDPVPLDSAASLRGLGPHIGWPQAAVIECAARGMRVRFSLRLPTLNLYVAGYCWLAYCPGQCRSAFRAGWDRWPSSHLCPRA